MIISPPFLRNRVASQSDADWTGAIIELVIIRMGNISCMFPVGRE